MCCCQIEKEHEKCMSNTGDALWKKVAIHEDVSLLILFKPKSEQQMCNIYCKSNGISVQAMQQSRNKVGKNQKEFKPCFIMKVTPCLGYLAA